jgi:glycosyltransferase involved in cell wall biosynthesis
MIALCLITKNSAATIDPLIEGMRPFVDGIFVYDTGSTDDTVAKLRAYNEHTHLKVERETGRVVDDVPVDGSGGELELVDVPLAPVVVEEGEWRNDFAWAREQSFAMPGPEFEWFIWADDDDVIVGAEQLRQLAVNAPADLNGYAAMYDYARDEHGNCVCVLWRERLMRRAAGFRWVNPVHEVLIPPDGTEPQLAQLHPQILRYVHNRPADRYEPGRNLEILRADEAKALAAGEPVSPRTLAYLGTELMSKGEWQEAAGYLQQYLDRRDAMWSDERMQVAHKLATCARLMGDALTSVEIEMQALRERDDWAETYVGLTESFAMLGNWDRVERWARRAIELGAPQSPLILNPLEFTMIPMMRIAESLTHRGGFDEAEEWLQKATAAAPGQPLVEQQAAQLRQARTEGETLSALMKLREILVRHDENEKAWRLMEAAPYIVEDHPLVVRARSDQREMVAHLLRPEEYKRWYEDDPKESTVTDEMIDPLCQHYGRIVGLMRGLAEQEGELGRRPLVLDLGCNDWWMGEYLARHGYRCDGVELNKRSWEKGIARRDRFGREATIVQGDLHHAPELLATAKGADYDYEYGAYDAVVMYEVFEHVPDTEHTLDVIESLLAPGGRVYLSTPSGAFEDGNLPAWARVERKGHLRAIPIHAFADQLMSRGIIEDLDSTDRVTFASYTPSKRKGTVNFYAGNQWEPWSPASIRDGGLGGSETALVQVATRLGIAGWKVKVYSGAEASYVGGVLFRPFTAWDPLEDVDLLVVSRSPHVFDNPLGAKQTALWCHDHSYPDQLTERRAAKIDHIVTLSDWHRDRFERLYPFAEKRLRIVRNGIAAKSLDGASRYPDAKRPFSDRKPRAVYSSSADRGLDVLLDLWPKIRHRVPYAELHVFYGFNVLDAVARLNPQLAAYKQALLQTVATLGGEDAGIFLRGRVGQVELAEEMMQARVLAYPTAFLETSCITAMEAQAAGLPIVTSDLGALHETAAGQMLIPWSDDEDEPANRSGQYQDRFVREVAAALTDEGWWNFQHAKALSASKSFDWSKRTAQWEKLAAAPVRRATRRKSPVAA